MKFFWNRCGQFARGEHEKTSTQLACRGRHHGPGCSATSAKAAYFLKYAEVGTDVVAKGSGSLDITDLSFVGAGEGSCFGASGLFALACVEPHSIEIDTYHGFFRRPA